MSPPSVVGHGRTFGVTRAQAPHYVLNQLTRGTGSRCQCKVALQYLFVYLSRTKTEQRVRKALEIPDRLTRSFASNQRLLKYLYRILE